MRHRCRTGRFAAAGAGVAYSDGAMVAVRRPGGPSRAVAGPRRGVVDLGWSGPELWVLDDRVDHFSDGRSTNGFDFQIEAVNTDVLAGRTQSEIMPLSASLRVQQHMDLIRSHF